MLYKKNSENNETLGGSTHHLATEALWAVGLTLTHKSVRRGQRAACRKKIPRPQAPTPRAASGKRETHLLSPPSRPPSSVSPLPFSIPPTSALRSPQRQVNGNAPRPPLLRFKPEIFPKQISLAFATAQTNKSPSILLPFRPRLVSPPAKPPSPPESQVSRPPAPTGRLTYPAGAEP